MKATMHFDGGSRGNPGAAAGAAIVRCEDGHEVSASRYLGDSVTNNVAEYCAMLLGLELAQEAEVSHLEIVGDSKLVICHLTGEWECNAPTLQPLLRQARGVLKGWFTEWDARHVRRKYNREADALVNRNLDARKRRLNEHGIRGFKR